MKKHNKTLSLDDLTAHQQRIKQIVLKINQYSPTFHLNPNYNQFIMLQNIQHQREAYEDKLFEQNMKIIERLETVESKIDLKAFPSVNLAARSKRKLSSLSEAKIKKMKSLRKYQIKDEDQIFQQNMQIIEKIQSAENKVECWQAMSLKKSRMLHQKRQKQKRQQILQKFKQIQRELKSLKVKKPLRSTDRPRPYLNQRMKTSSGGQTSFQTRTNFQKKKS